MINSKNPNVAVAIDSERKKLVLKNYAKFILISERLFFLVVSN